MMEENQNPTPQTGDSIQQPAPVDTNQPVTERTADQFTKLLDSNKRLAEQNEIYRKSLEILNTNKPTMQTPKASAQTPAESKAPAQSSNGLNVQDFIETDPSTGERYINEQKLAARLSEVEQRASRVDAVESELKGFMRTQQEQQMQKETVEAQRAFPELDPNSQAFDADFMRDVRARITDSMINPLDYKLGAGQRLEFKQAAELVKAQYARFGQAATQKVTEQQEQEAQQTVEEAKAQASASVSSPSSPANAYSTVADAELGDLRKKTRYGDDFALAKRLMHTEHISSRD